MARTLGTLLAVVVFAGVGCQKSDDDGRPGWELKPPAEDAKPVSASNVMSGIYPVGSRIKDQDAYGGFGACENFPHDLNGRDWGAEGAVAVVAFPEESVAYFKHRGFALRIVNRTSKPVPFAACDSKLFLVREAQDAGGEWKAIESAPREICGNSFHQVFLGPNQFWQFPAREYAGPMKAKLRFRLDPGDGRPAMYSNEFDGQVSAAQLAGD